MIGDFNGDERGASIAVTHALTLTITAVLITVLLVTTGNFLHAQQNTVAQSQLRDIGGDLSSLIDDADRLNRTGEVNATLSASYPDTIAGEPYTMELVPENGTRDTTATLYLNATDLDLSVSVPVATDTPMTRSQARSENASVKLCSGANGQTIVLRRCP